MTDNEINEIKVSIFKDLLEMIESDISYNFTDFILTTKLKQSLRGKITQYNLEVRSKDARKELELYKKAIEDIEVICAEQNLKFDTTACEVLDVIEKLFEGINNDR